MVRPRPEYRMVWRAFRLRLIRPRKPRPKRQPAVAETDDLREREGAGATPSSIPEATGAGEARVRVSVFSFALLSYSRCRAWNWARLNRRTRFGLSRT